MPGAKSIYVNECLDGMFIGVDWFDDIDLTNRLPDNWRDFNKEFIPIYLETYPDKTKIAAGLGCGMTWTVCKGLNNEDIVLMPDGKGNYHVGEVGGDYEYVKGEILPHRRTVVWYEETIARSDMSEALQRSTGSVGTSSQITKYAEEIERLMSGVKPPTLISTDETIEDPTAFVLEKHLEDFLVANWSSTELGKDYDIYSEDGVMIGQQFQSDTGPLDILAISKNKKELLVVELKKGRASDSVVGQVQRYMGYVLEELAEEHQTVKGVIIALDDDIRIQRALRVTNNIDFYRYQISFKLNKV